MTKPSLGLREIVVAVICGFLVSALSCHDSDDQTRPTITITNPTSAPNYLTTGTDVRIGGTISGAGFVHVRNLFTGFSTEGYVNYFQGQGSWFADIQGLAPGDNAITATADADGTGTSTATATITVSRPAQPANLIVNGPDQAHSNTFWTDMSSFNYSHKIALFQDGTGRATTGNVDTENAGIVTNFTWTFLTADAILISNCATCSFQQILRIAGSLGEGSFLGEVITTNGHDTVALHAFSLMSGNL